MPRLHMAEWRCGRPTVSSPTAATFPQSWTVTSDSLALWLGRRLGAECCYVIKSIDRRVATFSAGQLARDGVVDDAFPALLKDAGFPVFLLGRGDQPAFAACLSDMSRPPCGATID